MKFISRIWLIAALSAALAGGLLGSPQGNSDKNKKQQTQTDKDKAADKDKNKDNKDKDQDKNKTDDSGAKLNESPNGDDERVAQLMTGIKTNPDEAKVFVDNGKLKSR